MPVPTWRRLLAAFSPTLPAERVSGPPPSGNGASSLHLFWRVPPGVQAIAVEATVEVVEPPPADRLVFWALQATVEGPHGPGGTGHLGLQHHPRYPDRGAANWGGYRPGGGELPGGPLGAPSALDNPNTCNYPWEPRRRYRLRIAPAAPNRWRGSIVDDAGSEFVVRDLHVEGDHLASAMVWTESFAHCEERSAVRWSELRVVDRDRGPIAVEAVAVNYQARADGGCDTTDARLVVEQHSLSEQRSLVEQHSIFEQRTGVERRTPQGAVLGP